MTTITRENKEKSKETAREKRKALMPKSEGLTCTEDEVDSILSEGEST